jgi:3-phosphoshikimate 1-carboxyvinyltransferase
LTGLLQTSRQGDRGFADLLVEMGAEVAWEAGAMTVRGRDLQAVEADLSDLPDQVPTLAALAPFAQGTTRIFNVAHLRIKESDRLEAMATELRKLGAAVEEGPDWLRIPGDWAETVPADVAEVRIDPRGDHRIAMACALVGLRRPGVVITTPGVVAKSYPEFWRDLASLTSRLYA